MRRWLLAGVCTAAVIAPAAGGVSVAGAAELHAFDPILSLTGNCSTSTVDEEPDPGLCPGTPGVDHPLVPFSNPKAIATDSFGNIYVSSPGSESSAGAEGRIVIFDSKGFFITEVLDKSGPGPIAVDSEGNLYVANSFSTFNEGLVVYEPTTYEPATGEIDYDDPPTVLAETEASGNGLAINPLNDHLFRKRNNKVTEYDSAANGGAELGTILEGQIQSGGPGFAIDAARGRIYAVTWEGPPGEIKKLVKVFELAAPHNLLFKIEEADVPGGKIITSFMGLAVDEGTGNSFLYDGEGAKKVYEFDSSGSFLSTIQHSFQYTFLSTIAVDNGANSPNGALNPVGRYLFVPSHPAGTGHSFAFGPELIGPPIVESVSFDNVAEAEAELEASIEPFGLLTDYRFEYITEQRFEEEGETFTGAQLAGEGQIAAGNSPVGVSAAVTGLSPGTTYRFRVFAENDEGSDEAEGRFTTYSAAEPFELCSNEALRTGFSALLPDCRAYELVTPPNTNARAPRSISHLGIYFPMRAASPQGDALSFQIEGGTIPGSEAIGSLAGDPYLSTRDEEAGWSTTYDGPSGAEASGMLPGSTSPDQGHYFWSVSNGSAAIEGKETTYVHYPDGHSALVGRGSIADDQGSTGRLISEGGGHIVFESGVNNPAVQLEEDAPPDGTRTVYDRTADEVTHVVSLLPGDETPADGEDSVYKGASLDGRGVAFSIGATLYLRYDNEETFEIGEGVAFAGIAEGGSRLFYMEGGDLQRFDAQGEALSEFTTTGDVTPVTISPDGTTAYFISPSDIPEEVSPNGAEPIAGAENLYRSREGEIDFLATVTERDVEGEFGGNDQVDGLGLWLEAMDAFGRLAKVPARTTPDGGVLLFESRAQLDEYDPEGHAQVYRYDSVAGTLDCLSCIPTDAPAQSDASLQSVSQGLGDPEPFSSFAYVANLSSDGRRAFFQSSEALVVDDSDGLQDVYEWEAPGVGSCERAGGCVYLISSGHSLRTDYLWAVSDSADDVFFRSSDILLPRDLEETPSVYDARVGGGFPEPLDGGPCQGEGCRPQLTPPPPIGQPATPALGADDQVKEPRQSKSCPKGKRKVKRGGKVRCVKKKKAGHHRRHKAAEGKGTRR